MKKFAVNTAGILRTVVALAGFFTLCGANAIAEEKPVGVILPMTGDFARYGEKVKTGLESVPMESVRLVYEDEGCNPQKAVSAYKKLTAVDRAAVLIGPWCGSPQVAVASSLAHADQVAILGSSAPRRVFELSGKKMFSVQHSIEEESIFNAREAYRLGARRVVIVFLENDFSRAHEAAFRAEFRGEVIETLAYSAPDPAALRALAVKVKLLKPDTLYIPDAFPLMQGFLKQLAAIGITDKKIFSVYSAQSEDVLAAVGAAGEGLLYSYPKIEGEALHVYPRLAAEILKSALAACADRAPKCIRDAIAAQHDFDEFGVLRGEIVLKTIRNGMFQPY